MKMLGKILLRLALAVVILLILGGSAAGVKYYLVTRSGAQAEQVSGPERSEPVRLGEKFDVSAEFRLPWGIRPVSLSAEPAAGSQLTRPPYFVRTRRGWGSDLWKAVIPLQCYHEGKIPGGTAQAVFSNKQEFKLELPSVQADPPEVHGSQLEIAGELDTAKPAADRKYLLWIALAVLVLAAAGLALFRYLRRKSERKLMPWERALQAIRELLDTVRSGGIAPERSIARLTDIVREYMEERFRLRAERQTTAEFMADLERGKGGLDERHRTFLREFLTAADLVKFARMPADAALLENAAGKAGELIRETIPAEPGKETGK
ncbi:MAG: hypothetical protein IJS14_12765 [Lentisphaeria bacterium]|nr:hypothetical protein [Lentisphaeria bacterium]